jgi:hypothetical protein
MALLLSKVLLINQPFLSWGRQVIFLFSVLQKEPRLGGAGQ